MFRRKEINLLVSSDSSAGAKVSEDGSRFSIQLQDGIKIPRNSENVTVSLESATIWNTVSNITDINNKMFITGPDESDVIQNYEITLQKGLYDLPGLTVAILRELELAGAKTDPQPLIALTPDTAIQSVIMTLSYAGTIVDFSQPGTFREILGFNSATYSYATSPIHVAPNVAAFNQIDSFLIHSDLVSKGIRFNNNYNQSIGQVLITSKPGSQIVHDPFNPPRIDSSELAGANRTTLRFWLTDQANRRVDTTSEIWTARIVIRYEVPMVVGRLN